VGLGARRKESHAPPAADVRAAGAPPRGARPRPHTHTPPAAPAASTVPLWGRQARAPTWRPRVPFTAQVASLCLYWAHCSEVSHGGAFPRHPQPMLS